MSKINEQKEKRMIDFLLFLTGGYYSLLVFMLISVLSTGILSLVFKDAMLAQKMLIITTKSNFSLLFGGIMLLVLASFTLSFWYTAIKAFVKNGKTDCMYIELWNPVTLTLIFTSTVGLIYLASCYLSSYTVIKMLIPSGYLKGPIFIGTPIGIGELYIH